MNDKPSEPEVPPVTLESGIEVKPVYRPEDVEATGGDGKIGEPGEYPFTRGIHPLMYRSRPWTMRQYSGFGTARATNERFLYLIAHGNTGLNVAFDLPTQVGLDSDEHGNPPLKFKSVYEDAAAQGYRLTMHCDVDQENSVGHIWQALDEIGVERIDHGINSLEDPALVRELVARDMGLTLCPISNRYVVQDSRSGDLKQMLDAGMRPTVNSDDPAYFRGYMNANLEVAAADGELTEEEVTQLMRNAFEVSWAPDADKTRHLARLDAYA